jgi:uncharacterized protein YjbI with pentapeptide repeats
MGNGSIMKRYLHKSIWFSVLALFVCVYTVGAVFAKESVTTRENLEKLVKTKSCKGCDLSGLTLNRLDLTDADLEGADLSLAKLSLTNLTRANLRNTDLRGAIFGGTDLSDADLRGADLRGTSLDSSYHEGAKFDGKFIAAQSQGDVGETEVEKEVFIADPVKPKASPETRPANVGERRDSAESAPSAASKGKTEAMPQKLHKVEKDSQNSVSHSSAPIAKKVTPVQQVQVDVPVQDGKLPTTPGASMAPFKEETKKPVGVEAVTAIPENKATVSTSKENAQNPVTATTPKTAMKQDAKNASDVEPGAAEASNKGAEGSRTVPAPAQSPAVAQVEIVKDSQQTPQKTAVKGSETMKVTEEKPAAAAQKPIAGKTKEDYLQILLDKKKCFGCDLSGLDLAGKNLDSADLEKANLTGCNLEGADLDKANLKGAILRQANLRQAKLKNADLYKADLSGADLTGAKVGGAMFDSAQTASAVGLKEAIEAAAK